jgi:hypothetical protein
LLLKLGEAFHPIVVALEVERHDGGRIEHAPGIILEEDDDA